MEARRGTSDANAERRELELHAQFDDDTTFTSIGVPITAQLSELKSWKLAFKNDPKLWPAI